MKGIRIATMIGGVVLACAGTTHAAFLATGPLRLDDNPANGTILQCAAVNVGNKDIEVAITATLEATDVQPPQVLGPGESASLFNLNSGPGSREGWCRFNLVAGKKAHLKASACALDQNNNCRAYLRAK